MVSFQIPKEVDDYYKGKAAARIASKSMVMRDVVMEHWQKQPDKDEFKQSKKKQAIAA